jgi:predicted RNA-binding protein with PIN domain
MDYVVDACNLIFRDRFLEETLDNRGFQAARAQLVAMLSTFAQTEGLKKIIAVFDGSEKAAHRPRRQSESSGKVVLFYADPRANADRMIVEMVENAKRPGEITVVSSDKGLVRQVQRAQGHSLSCRDFLRQARLSRRHAMDPLHGEDPRKFIGNLSDREIEEWMKYFNF